MLTIDQFHIGIEHGALVIRISVEELCAAAEQSTVFEYADSEGNVSRYRISDPKQFAESVLRQIKSANQQGETLVTDMLAEAFAMVVTLREPGVHYEKENS